MLHKREEVQAALWIPGVKFNSVVSQLVSGRGEQKIQGAGNCQVFFF